MRFNTIYQNASDKDKLGFLDAKIKQNEALQKEFETFVQKGQQDLPSQKGQQNLPSMSFKEFRKIVQNNHEEYLVTFESIDIENPDWELYEPLHDGYIEEWEAYQLASEAEFRAIFENTENEAVDYIHSQNITGLTACLIGLFEATQNAEIQDDIGSFNDIDWYLQDELQYAISNIIDKIHGTAIHGSAIILPFELCMKYFKDKDFNDEKFPVFFEHYLMALAQKYDQAERLIEITNNAGIKGADFPSLLLQLYNSAGNKKEWMDIATGHYQDNPEVAKQLLKYYFEHEKTEFIEKALELLDQDKYLWADFLQHYITPELDKKLFIEVFFELCLSESDIAHYKKIRKLINKKTYETLVSKIGPWDSFIIQIFDLEGQYERIKDVIEQTDFEWEFNNQIRPILNIYPDYCFEKIKNKSLQKIEYERGRIAYKMIATWMQLAKEIKGYEAKANELIDMLYNYNPRLIALKDEFREAGIK